MMFAHLRRSVALWICPELRPVAGPIPVGFFDAEEARALSAERREWHEAELTRGLKAAKVLGVDAAHRIKALYPTIKNVGDVGAVTVPEIAGHFADAGQQEQLRCGIVPKCDGRGQQPDVCEERKAEFNGIDVVRDGVCGHGSSLSGDGQPQGMTDAVAAKRFLLELAEALAAHDGVGLFAISMRALRKGDFFQNMKLRGTDCRTQTAAKLFVWFSDNWPGDLEWPRHIPRPPKTKKEAA